MSEAETALVKYVFLDVVGFTKERSVEAQSDIVQTLNKIVKSSLKEFRISTSKRILLPTGDGICIALVGTTNPYDLHILIALKILQLLENKKRKTLDKSRHFEIRIGINENVDNLITDVNNKKNVAGQGINMAQRVMSCADGNQIFISKTVHEIVNSREKYSKKTTLYHATTKHGDYFSVYQLKDNELTYLNCNTPTAFRTKSENPKELSPIETYYIVAALKNESYLEKDNTLGAFDYAAFYLNYATAYDLLSMSSIKKNTRFFSILPVQNDVNKAFLHYSKQDLHLLARFIAIFKESATPSFGSYFVDYRSIFLSESGKANFKTKYPDLYKLACAEKDINNKIEQHQK